MDLDGAIYWISSIIWMIAYLAGGVTFGIAAFTQATGFLTFAYLSAALLLFSFGFFGSAYPRINTEDRLAE